MTATTNAYCERCGTSTVREAPTPRALPALVSRVRTMAGLERPTTDDGLRLCLGCRGFVCGDCLNDQAGMCLDCAPVDTAPLTSAAAAQPLGTQAKAAPPRLRPAGEEEPAWPLATLPIPARPPEVLGVREEAASRLEQEAPTVPQLPLAEDEQHAAIDFRFPQEQPIETREPVAAAEVVPELPVAFEPMRPFAPVVPEATPPEADFVAPRAAPPARPPVEPPPSLVGVPPPPFEILAGELVPPAQPPIVEQLPAEMPTAQVPEPVYELPSHHAAAEADVAEPVVAYVTVAEEHAAEPVAGDAAVEPMAAEPVDVEAVAVEPVAVAPVSVEPIAVEPAAARTGPAQPVVIAATDQPRVVPPPSQLPPPRELPPAAATSSAVHAQLVAQAAAAAPLGRECVHCQLPISTRAAFCRRCGTAQPKVA